MNDDQIVRLATIEERVLNIHESLRRTEDHLQSIETRLNTIEQQEPMQTLASKWVVSAVWAAAGAAVYFVAKFLGIL